VQKTIDLEHGLDDFDEEERFVDPMVLMGFLMPLVAMSGLILAHVVKRLF
jgi:hypothetical protein